MASLWKRMIELFGYKFSSSFGETPNDTWARVLSGLSAVDVCVGLNACVERWEEKFPPDAREFRNLCLRKKQNEGKTFLGLEYKPDKTPRMNYESRKKFLRKIREVLDRKSVV